MPLEKESLNNFLPDGFETNNLEGAKENFSADKIATGYEKDVKDRVSGPNFNNLLDVIGKNTNVLTKFMDFIKNMPVNNLFAVDENNQLVYKNLDEVGGGGLEIGDIGIAPLGINENQNKRRYLNGQIMTQIPFLSFTTKLKEAVALYPSLACTEDEWQTIATMTVGGQVGKFVIDDDAKTIRLPKIIMPIQGLTDLSKLAEIVEAGLPNIDGSFKTIVYQNYVGTGSFKLDSKNINSASSAGSNIGQGNFSFNASRSNSTYGNSNTVQQEQIRYPYFIQVATGVEKTEDVDRDIVLNNPFFFGMYQWFDVEPNNASWLISNGTFHEKIIYSDYYDWLLRIYNGTETQNGVSVKLHTEAYGDEDFVINQENETFRLPLRVKQAFFYSQNIPVVGNGMSIGLTNGTVNAGLIYSKATSNTSTRLNPCEEGYGVPLGASISGTPQTGSETAWGITTDATKSGIEAQLGNAERKDLKLYFYVGVVNQDAPLINSGRALEILPKKLDKEQLYNKMTNCITEIPQRIKYTLVDGTLTIKAGSVVIVPYGVEDLTSQYPKGATFIHENFKVYDTQFEDGKFFVWAELQSDLFTNSESTIIEERFVEIDITQNGIHSGHRSESGTNNQTSSDTYTIYYNTAINRVGKTTEGTTLSFAEVRSLPFLKTISTTTTRYASVTQVFNGIGYIGSTIWVDKGIKGLAPDGRNADGTLNNKLIEYTKVYTRTFTSGSSSPLWFAIQSSGVADLSVPNYIYNEKENKVQKISTGEFQNPTILAGSYTRGDGGVITSFETNTTTISLANHNNIDGYLVSKNTELAKDVTYPTTKDIEYDLSNYLPKDNCIYTLIIQCNVVGTKASTACNIQVSSSQIGNLNVCCAYSTNALATGTLYIPIGTDRVLTVKASSAYSGKFTMIARGYRRLGNNS